ncbi:S41 family peptidase [Phreatobacter stygius]|uniref:PDZ domain-containing protein n=1 Tax=Phreatobacter stygius TaxID=1940610 RepID=A0A4D7B7Z5_9HYPH|nr:S41 family peptidase [Phreatobacter stygius]QCI67095.1 PDZ domain-containing protein [Phreatobacter stygius]
MKLSARLIIAALVIGSSPVAAWCQTAPADAAHVSGQIDEIIRRRFYDPQRLPAFEAVASTRGANLDWVAAALAALGASHTGRYTPDQIDYYEVMDAYRTAGAGDRAREIFPPDGTITYAGIGLVPRRIEGKIFAAYVYDGSPADKAGVRTGDEILSVDGQPFHEIGSFQTRIGQTVDIAVRRTAEAQPLTIAVPVIAIRPADMLRDAIRDSVRIVERDGKRLGYLRIWTYAVPGVRRLLAELLTTAPLKDADGLVLDMRGRWGGAPADAAEMFIGRSLPMELVGRDGNVVTANMRWQKPMVGLIDAGARSGMEILASGLKKAGIPLVGAQTAGAVLAGRGFVLGDNSLLIVAVMDVRVDGGRLEGSGVVPDIAVAFDRRYADGADPQRERAIGLLAERLRH